ncbi:hypothetical protein DNTS_015967 [Danionella cerebrum]|uniref:L-serine deaminase n=1 Tax=Danionella cerebrum TaxID=2873325 RepID=A0A553RHJ9_9TELE|nr:hypothetical protein DNTS_015967 [Danionella translucida]
MNFAAQFFASFVNEGLQTEETGRGFNDSEEYDPFWQSTETSRPDCSTHSNIHSHIHLENGSLGCRSTLICPERLKDFGAEEILNGDPRNTNTLLKIPESTNTQPKNTESIHTTPKSPDYRREDEMSQKSKPVAIPTAEELHKSAAEPQTCLRLEDINAATLRLQQNGIQRTPCMYSRLSKQLGMEIYLKKEVLHYTHSVKERGVLNLLSSLSKGVKGVFVASDCSFSLAVAHLSVRFQLSVFVILPVCVAPSRLCCYRDCGAAVISYGSIVQDSILHARMLAREHGFVYLEEGVEGERGCVYEAGLGSVGLEMLEQVPGLQAVLVPAGGSCALLGGTAAAIKHLKPDVTIIGVEPEECPVLQQCLKANSLITDLHCKPNRTLYRDLVDQSLGPHSFHLAKAYVDKVVSVRESDVLLAMLHLLESDQSLVSAEGALGIAGLLSGKLPELRGKRVGVVVSGGHLDLDLLLECVDRALVLDQRVGRFSLQLGQWPGEMAKLMELLAREDVRDLSSHSVIFLAVGNFLPVDDLSVILPNNLFDFSVHSVCTPSTVQFIWQGLLEVYHKQCGYSVDLFKSQVECVVGTRDKSQNLQLRRKLVERYPSLQWLTER